VVDNAENTTRVEKALARQFGGRLRFGSKLDYRIVTADYSMLQNIRDTQCIVGWRD